MDSERIARIQDALKQAELDAVVCTLPSNVLLVSGYWPVVGTSVAVVTRDGGCLVLAPEDEKELAERSGAEVRTYKPTTLDKLQTVAQAAAVPLKNILQDFQLTCARLGYEYGPSSEPSSYTAMHLFGGSIVSLLREAAPANSLAPADPMLARLAAVKTPAEVESIRTACQIAGHAFELGRSRLQAGMQETAVAELFRGALLVHGTAHPGVSRAQGFAWCMAGKNSARASGAYSRSRADTIGPHEFVLVHCNSCADGYWTDITRTYVLGAPEQRQLRLYEAVMSARAAALAAIRPGALAAEVDRAARDVLASRGVADAFKHPAGHGVGFAAISANARPQIHPQSHEVLQTGMVFNLEPAVYFEGYGGLRHCEMVAVGPSGADVLTPFQTNTTMLLLEKSAQAA